MPKWNSDAHLLGREGVLYRVYAPHRIDLSPETRKNTGFWSADEIKRGSAAINAIVKFAVTLILPEKEQKLSRETIDTVGDAVAKKRIVDVRVALWEAAWLLISPPPKPKLWRESWEHSTKWLDGSMDVDLRLNTLYRLLVGYSLFVVKGEEAARKFGASPSETQRYKDMQLDPTRVYETISLLSHWRRGAWTLTSARCRLAPRGIDGRL